MFIRSFHEYFFDKLLVGIELIVIVCHEFICMFLFIAISLKNKAISSSFLIIRNNTPVSLHPGKLKCVVGCERYGIANQIL